MLSPDQYKSLYSAHLTEYNQKLLEEKVQSMAVYISQSEDIISIVQSETIDTFIDKKRLGRFIAELDRQLDFYNADFTDNFGISLEQMGSLAYDQLYDFTDLAGLTVDQTLVKLQDAFIRDLIVPIEVPEFNLSTAIWSDPKRVDIFQIIIQASNSGLTPSQITQSLANYLTTKNAGVGNQYYNAERVVETELQRAYTRANVDSTRDYNREYDSGLIIHRELSPVHKVADICDTLAGYYDPSGYVPTVVHPFDMCSNRRVFKEDVGNVDIKNLTSRVFIDTKHNQRARLY